MSDEASEHPLANVPDNVRSLFEIIGVIDTSDSSEDIQQIVAPLEEGMCMTCGTQLGETTVVIVNNKGITAGYCGGPCMQDMAVLGWLQEEHDDVVDRVRFRGGQEADRADGESES